MESADNLLKTSSSISTPSDGLLLQSIVEAPKSSESVDYDPHKHRNRSHPTTNAETLIHMLKGSLGTGILAMPNAFSNAGYLTGTIATILIGFLATYCLHILVKAQYQFCKRLKVPILSYPQSMKVAFEQGPPFLKPLANASPKVNRGSKERAIQVLGEACLRCRRRIIVDGFLIVYQLGICCVYIVFVATNIQKIADYYLGEYDIKTHMLLLLIPLTLINYIPNLKLLAPFSTLANIITFIGLGMIMSFVFEDLPSLSEREMFGSIRGFSLYFGTTLFALEAVGVIIALENNMKTPKNFGGTFGILNIGMFIIVILYIIVGFFGYLKYGESDKGSITLNLPDTMMAQCIKLMFAIAIFITYALQAYVPVEIIWSTYMDHRIKKNKVFWEYICRTCVTLVTFVLAISIPRLGLFISLFGALCLSALGIAFPAILEICVLYPNNFGPFKIVLLKDIGLIIFGCIGLVVGTYTSLSDIIHSFDQE